MASTPTSLPSFHDHPASQWPRQLDAAWACSIVPPCGMLESLGPRDDPSSSFHPQARRMYPSNQSLVAQLASSISPDVQCSRSPMLSSASFERHFSASSCNDRFRHGFDSQLCHVTYCHSVVNDLHAIAPVLGRIAVDPGLVQPSPVRILTAHPTVSGLGRDWLLSYRSIAVSKPPLQLFSNLRRSFHALAGKSNLQQLLFEQSVFVGSQLTDRSSCPSPTLYPRLYEGSVPAYQAPLDPSNHRLH